MITLPALTKGIAYATHQFFGEMASAGIIKAMFGIIGAIITYTIGINSISIFLALATMVLLEFIVHLFAYVHVAMEDGNWTRCGRALEAVSFATALQLVVYGALTSSGHLVDGIILGGGSFLESAVISFLAVSQLIRIIKASSQLGYSVPPFLVDMMKSYLGTPSDTNHKS